MPVIHMLVPAAGVGRRFGGDCPKQYQRFVDGSLLDHTLGQLLQLGLPGPVWLGLSAEDGWWSDSRWYDNPAVSVYSGGETRVHTVAAGLEKIGAGADDWVLVHDAVRPCITPDSLAGLFQAVEQVAAQAGDIAGLAPGEPVHQAVKRVDSQGRVTQVVDREGLWQTQTPQLLRLDALKRSLAYCLQQGIAVDDELAALHQLGFGTRLVAGSQYNIKVTREPDMLLARRYWQLMQETV